MNHKYKAVYGGGYSNANTANTVQHVTIIKTISTDGIHIVVECVLYTLKHAHTIHIWKVHVITVNNITNVDSSKNVILSSGKILVGVIVTVWCFPFYFTFIKQRL